MPKGRDWLLLARFYDVKSALFDRNKCAISRDFIGNGKLQSAVDGLVFELVLASLDAHALAGFVGRDQRKVFVSTAGNQVAGGANEMSAIVAVGNVAVDMTLA